VLKSGAATNLTLQPYSEVYCCLRRNASPSLPLGVGVFCILWLLSTIYPVTVWTLVQPLWH